jgi:hypothetical protein
MPPRRDDTAPFFAALGVADDCNEPLPAELKIAYCWRRLAFIERIPDDNARIATVNAH